jgi:hypothetical protein
MAHRRPRRCTHELTSKNLGPSKLAALFLYGECACLHSLGLGTHSTTAFMCVCNCAGSTPWASLTHVNLGHQKSGGLLLRPCPPLVACPLNGGPGSSLLPLPHPSAITACLMRINAPICKVLSCQVGRGSSVVLHPASSQDRCSEWDVALGGASLNGRRPNKKSRLMVSQEGRTFPQMVEPGYQKM